MASEGSKGDPRKGPKVKATKAAVRLAEMYLVDLDDVPFLGAKVTVEDVKKHLEAPDGPERRPDGAEESLDLPGNGPAPDALPPPAAPEPTAFNPGDRVMVRKKFLGTVAGFVEASDGKRRWLVKSPSHSSDVETVGYATEDLARALA